MTGRPFVLSCSPRANGNCDTAAGLFREGLGVPTTRKTISAGPETDPVPLLALRDIPILPCVSCGQCIRHPGLPCPLAAKDGSAILLRALETAPALCFVAPIYFYHLPARFKAFIDRGQARWAAHTAQTQGPERKAWVILIGAREAGDKLFEGSLLTLRFWLEPFGITLAPPLCLYGLDDPRALAEDKDSRAWIRDYAATARQAFDGVPL